MTAQTASHHGPSRSVSDDAALSRSLLIICAHGSAYHPTANDHVIKIAEQLRQSGSFFDVQAVFHTGKATEWSVTNISPSAIDQILIVPYMMSDGFLAKQMINKTKQAIRDAGIQTPVFGSPAVGTHPLIADLALKLAIDTTTEYGTSPDEISLVIVAHGSRNAPQSRLGAEQHLQSIQEKGVFKRTALALIEEPPFVTDILRTIDGPAVVVGLFAAPGGHAIVDIAEAIAEAARDDLMDAGPIGLHTDMHELIQRRSLQTLDH